MKQFIPTTKLFILMLMLTAVFLAACDVEPVEITQIPLEASPTANLPVTEVTVKIVTPEPTPTTAVCTPLPADMTTHIQYESDLHGMIEVTGLQSGETPIVLITGDSLAGSYREESTTVQEVGADGRFQHTFDFRSWPSVEGYTFKGQLIHQRGVACFDLEIPFVEPPVSLDETAVSSPVTTTQTADTEAIIARLETLQIPYEQMVRGYEGWLYMRYTEYFPTALHGSQEAINFLWLADTWVWESWHEIRDGVVNRQINHISDEEDGVWQQQLMADGWSIFVLPTEMTEGRVQPYDYPAVNANKLGGASWLIQMLQEKRNPTVTAWEADNLYHVVLEDIQETPTEIVGLPAPVTRFRHEWVFDSETGLLQQQSSEALLTNGEWHATGSVTYTNFDLLSQLPQTAANTLAAGTALLSSPR